MNKKDKKKLISFNDIYDYNFLLYNILLILNNYKCTDKDRCFVDYRKLPILIEIINSDKIRSIIMDGLNNSKSYPDSDKDILYDCLSRTRIMRKQIYQLILTLSKKEIINIQLNNKSMDISIIKSKDIHDFLVKKLFIDEKSHLSNFDKCVQRIRILKYETLIDKIFDSKGVITWQI